TRRAAIRYGVGMRGTALHAVAAGVIAETRLLVSRDLPSIPSSCLKPEAVDAFPFSGAHFSRVESSLFVSGKSTGQRNDGAALAASYIRHHLDRPALFFQPGSDAGDEASRTGGARENLSGADVQSDGVVSLVVAGHGAGRPSLFSTASFCRRAARGRPFAGHPMAGLVASRLGGRLPFHLRVSAPCQRNF